MLRPKRMSKVSVTGSKTVMDDVIETVHGLHLLHLSDYDGRWEGFSKGDPVEGAEEASEKLVTVRALESTLGVEPEDAGPSRIVSDEELDEELEEIRVEVNELDDRRNDLEDELRRVEEEIDAMEPFATLGIDLDLLYGYDSLSVAVGEGDAGAVERVLAGIDAPTEVFSEEGVVAAFAATDEGTLQDALVEAAFTAVDVPGGEGDPGEYLEELESERRTLESKLSTVEEQIEDLRYEVAGFLLAAEEKLSIEVAKAEAPLTFATTDNAFVAEGWIPEERVDDLAGAVDAAVGEHADVEELEVASYGSHGHAETTEEVHGDEGVGERPPGEAPAAADGPTPDADDAEQPGTAADGGSDRETATDGGEPGAGRRPASEPRSDGGVVTMGDDDPPVIQDNPGLIKPFELLTKAVGRPNYSEFDPTIVLFLTFPLMFGFMIGDVGYGLIYTAIGYYVYANFDSRAFRNFGIVAAAAGIMTTVFGVLYGEIFGLHLVTSMFWEGVVGLKHAPIEKGLSPATSYWAEAWFVITALFGVLHLNVGYVMEFLEQRVLHGTWEAIVETGSWLLALNGLWLFVFSDFLRASKPDLIFTVFAGEELTGEVAAFPLGFTGLPAGVGMVGVAMLVAGMGLLAIGPAYELIEIHVTLAHALSYLRIAAVLLAKAGMAFAVNLLFFGAYRTHGEFHFMLTHGPEYVLSHHEDATIMFGGMVHGGPAMLVFGIAVLLVGHLVVLLLGITSSGIQSIRLEYFEFFSKFYEGNGRTYTPFGSDRNYTAEE